MIPADQLIHALKRSGNEMFTGVPCSYMTHLFATLEHTPAVHHVSAASEGEAVAIATGAWLAGARASAMCQNSGLGNMVNPLTSLVAPYEVPLLLFVSRRGWPTGSDEPQHDLMGRITRDLLATMEIESAQLPSDPAELRDALAVAERHLEARRPYAFVVEKGRIGRPEAPPGPRAPSAAPGAPPVVERWTGGPRPRRPEVLAAYLDAGLTRPVIATTGYTSRELNTLCDADRHLYMVGSMGCAAGIGLGVALAGDVPVTVLDGDGALLMKLGTLATVGRQAPRRFLHVLLDNGIHESTGGQPTSGPDVDFPAIAAASGYRWIRDCDGLDAFRRALAAGAEVDGPAFIRCRVAPGTLEKLGRPTVLPRDVASRFRSHVVAMRARA